MAPPQHTVQHRFSAAAASYDNHAAAQRTAADLLLANLPELASPSRILEVGCGTGHVTSLLRARFPQSPIDALDRSPAMIRYAKEQLGATKDIQWHAGDLMSFAPTHRYPLIVSNAALHWIDPIADAFARLYELAALQAHLACVVMLDGTLGELRESRLRVAPEKPPLGRLPLEAEVVDALNVAGFALNECSVKSVETRYESADEFLCAIHDMGLTGGRVSRGSSPLNRGDLERLRTDYQNHYSDSAGHIVATYRFLLVHARAT